MTDSIWKEKIMAYLHDPPHKLIVSYYYRISHERVAERLQELILGESVEPETALYEQIKQADRLASAMCRLLVEQLKEPIEIVVDEALEDETVQEKPSITKRILKTINDTGYIAWIDPWRGSESKRGLRLKLPMHRVLMTLEKIVKHTDESSADRYRLLFHLLFRILPEMLHQIVNEEKRYVMLEFPADTRAPNHSLFEHVTETSALYRCLPNPGLLLFTLGPVQAFIATARKTADLFGGSYLLSYLVWTAIKPIIEQWGPDHLIYPSMFHQGLYDRYLLVDCFRNNDEIRELLSERPYPWHKLVQVPNLPNRFLAFVPMHEIGQSLEEITGRVQNEWLRLVSMALRVAHDLVQEPATPTPIHFDERIRELLESSVEALFKDTSPGVRKWVMEACQQAQTVFRIHASVVPLALRDVESAADFFGADAVDIIVSTYREFAGPKAVPTELEQLVDILKSNPAYRSSLSVTLAYPLVVDLLERYHRANREDHRILEKTAGQRGRLCSLCGERVEIGTLWVQNVEGASDSAGGSLSYEGINRLSDERFWERLRRPAVNGGIQGVPVLVRPGERLCAVCFTKRLFPIILEHILNRGLTKKRIRIRRFPSTREVAATAFKRRLFEGLKEQPVEFPIFEKVRYLIRILKKAKKDFNIDYETYCLNKFIHEIQSIRKGDPTKADQLEDIMKIEAGWLTGDESVLSEYEGSKEWPKLKNWFKDEYLKALDEFRREWNNITRKAYPSASRYYALVVMDADHMGQHLKGERLKTVLEYLHSEARADLESHPDVSALADIRHPMIPAWQSSLSRYLGEFAGRVIARMFHEEEYAQLIYAGGDDVMFMAPIEDALRIAKQIRDEFQTHVLKEGDMSAGVVFAHEKIPLRIVLEQARKAERSAKERRGRSAFEIRVIKRSGDIVACGFKWAYADGSFDVVECLHRFQQSLRDETAGLEADEAEGNGVRVASRFAYRLAALYRDAGLDIDDGRPATPEAVALAKQLLQFQLERSTDREQDKKAVDALLESLNGLLEHCRSPRDFLQALLAFTFVSRAEAGGE